MGARIKIAAVRPCAAAISWWRYYGRSGSRGRGYPRLSERKRTLVLLVGHPDLLRSELAHLDYAGLVPDFRRHQLSD